MDNKELEISTKSSKSSKSNEENTDTLAKSLDNGDAKAGIHKTSIEATKGSLVPLRPTKATLAGWHIETVHIVFFLGLLVFLFFGMWVNGKKTKF